jgi:hypothetical protein
VRSLRLTLLSGALSPTSKSENTTPRGLASRDTNDLPPTEQAAKQPQPARRQSLLSSFGYSSPQTATQIVQSAPAATSTAVSSSSGAPPKTTASRGMKLGRKKRVDETMSTAEKQRIDLERTLLRKPEALEAHRLMCVRVFRPHVSVIVDKPVTLKPGSELFTFRLGPLEKGWKPFGYEANQMSAHARTSVINHHPSIRDLSRPSEASPTESGGQGIGPASEPRSVPTAGFDDDDEEEEFGPEVIPLEGCPMLVQTSRHIKILAQVSSCLGLSTVSHPSIIRSPMSKSVSTSPDC